MKSKVPKYHRRSTRLKGFDYSSPGIYFITICTKNRLRLFGNIIDKSMELNKAGQFVMACWNEIPIHYQKVKLHPFVIMPNHIHGIIEITSAKNILIPHPGNSYVGVQDIEPLQNDQSDGESENDKSRLVHRNNQYQHIIPGSLGSIVRGFEIGVTKWFRANTEVQNVWQRNYHDTIIRSERAYHAVSNYIINNPKNWEEDEFYNGE